MDQLQALLQSGQLASNNFPVTSRYHSIEMAVIDGLDDQRIVYLKRRIIPQPGHYFGTQRHMVQQGERIDNITAKYLLDPEQFWQVSDANLAMKPQELTEVIGRMLKIPQGAGISGL